MYSWIWYACFCWSGKVLKQVRFICYLYEIEVIVGGVIFFDLVIYELVWLKPSLLQWDFVIELCKFINNELCVYFIYCVKQCDFPVVRGRYWVNGFRDRGTWVVCIHSVGILFVSHTSAKIARGMRLVLILVVPLWFYRSTAMCNLLACFYIFIFFFTRRLHKSHVFRLRYQVNWA